MDISTPIKSSQYYKMINKIINRIFKGSKPVNHLDQYIKNGHIVVGKNCKLQQLKIYISDPENQVNYITIGDDCMISGSIFIQGKNARVNIGNGVFIGNDTKLFCREKITVGDDIMISWGCTLIDTNAHSLHSSERLSDVRDWIKGEQLKNWDVVESKPITIENLSWIGFNSIVTKGVTIKKGTVIGCGSVLTKSTEAFGVYGGNPATLIKKTD